MTSPRAAYMHEYQQRPEVKERKRQLERERYQDPQYRARLLERVRARSMRPDVREQRIEYLRKRRLTTAHLPEIKERRRAYSRKWRLTRVYGIDADEFDRMREAQNGTCAICRVGPIECIDHDHARGSIRGLLCHQCNMMLGLAGDDPERLRVAAQYIESHRTPR